MDRLLSAAGRRGAILAYHGVASEGIPTSPLHITPRTFEHHLSVFRSRGYSFLRLGEFVERLKVGAAVGRCIAITFDDAYAGVLELLPFLRARDAPATIFVPTALVGEPHPFWWDLLDRVTGDERTRRHFIARLGLPLAGGDGEDESTRIRSTLLLSRGGTPDDHGRDLLRQAAGAALDPRLRAMSWRELESWMGWEGADCAPHTRCHTYLPILSPLQQEAEIRGSYEDLAARFSRTLPIIAYPYGLYDGAVVASARRAGMTAGVTMDRYGAHPKENDLFAVPRLPYSGATPPERLGLTLSGPFRWLRRLEMPGGRPRLPA